MQDSQEATYLNWQISPEKIISNRPRLWVLKEMKRASASWKRPVPPDRLLAVGYKNVRSFIP